MIYLRLFFEFAKTGLFAIGGGLATLPFLSEMAETTGWFTQADLANMIAISESTPGPIGINMATYVGYTTGGIFGAIIASIGLITPSIIIILIIATILNKFKSNSIVTNVFYGLRPASTALIAVAGCGVLKISLLTLDLFNKTGLIADLFNIKAIIFAVILFFAISKLKLHPIFFIVISAVVGIVFKFQ
ncbi:MAG: chromate transporter [Oscillospiraceae bacterium]